MISKKFLGFEQAHLQFQFFLRYFESLVIQSDRNLPLRTTLFKTIFFSGIYPLLTRPFPLNHPVIVKPLFRMA